MFINGLVGFELISPSMGEAFMYGSTGALLARPEFWKWFIRIGLLIYSLTKLFQFLVDAYRTKGRNLIIPGLATSLVAILAITISSMLTGCSYNLKSLESGPGSDNQVTQYTIDDNVDNDIDSLEVSVSGDLYIDSEGVFSSSFATPNQNEVHDFSDEVSFGTNVVVSNSFLMEDYLGTGNSNSPNFVRNNSSSKSKDSSPIVYTHSVADPIVPRLGRFVCSQESTTLRCSKKFYCEQYRDLTFVDSNKSSNSYLSNLLNKGRKKYLLSTCLLWTNKKLANKLADIPDHRGLAHSKQLLNVISVYRSCKKRKIKNGFDFVNPFSNLRKLTRSSDDTK